MNISTGISEVITDISRTGKAYIWPNYNPGKVPRVEKTAPFRDEPIYYKPGKSEMSQIIKAMNETQTGYNSDGKIELIHYNIMPGSLFSATA